MAMIENLKTYADIEAGKRILSVPAERVPAIRVWLQRKGYAFQTRTRHHSKITTIRINGKR